MINSEQNDGSQKQRNAEQWHNGPNTAKNLDREENWKQKQNHNMRKYRTENTRECIGRQTAK